MIFKLFTKLILSICLCANLLMASEETSNKNTNIEAEHFQASSNIEMEKFYYFSFNGSLGIHNSEMQYLVKPVVSSLSSNQIANIICKNIPNLNLTENHLNQLSLSSRYIYCNSSEDKIAIPAKISSSCYEIDTNGRHRFLDTMPARTLDYTKHLSTGALLWLKAMQETYDMEQFSNRMLYQRILQVKCAK